MRMPVRRTRRAFHMVLGFVSAGLMAAPADNPAALANGVYAVLRDGLTRDEARPERGPYITLLYDKKYSEADRNEPPKYVALDTSSFVALILNGPPEVVNDDRGWALLHVTLAPEHVKTLETFTRAHLGGRVATVVDGEIVTMHKVRSVIDGGRVQISRCRDNACEVLRVKLVKSMPSPRPRP